MGNGARATGDLPGPLDTWIGSAQIALHTLVNERLKRVTPDLMIRPDVAEFTGLDFNRIGEILRKAEASKDLVKRGLAELLDNAR